MVVEKLIKNKKEYYIQTLCGEIFIFNSEYEYLYDGVTFLYGKKQGQKGYILMEYSTGAVAVHAEEVSRNNIYQAIEILKTKIAKRKSIHSVIHYFRINFTNALDLWKINLLII